MVNKRDNFLGDKNPNYKTGLRARGVDKELHGLYNTWQNMKSRCLNVNNPKYKRYGGRGITICPEWVNIQGFKNWAEKSGYRSGLCIDRIDNDGNYCPENCRWVSVAENSRQKSTTKLTMEQATRIRERLENGESEFALAKEYGVVHGTIWFIAKIFTHVADGECTKKIKERNK